MKQTTGRIVIHGAMGPEANMAVDEVLARQCDAGAAGFPVLRFYWWNVPTLSLGAKERLDQAADRAACDKENIALVRRPTGGRAVLHDHELTYAIIAPLGKPPFSESVSESYREIAEAQARGLKSLGIDLQLTAGGRKIRPQTPESKTGNPPAHLPCFAAPSRYELTWNGKKVIGSAQRRLRNAVLQHGSILLRGDGERLARATGAGRRATESLTGLLIGLEEITGKNIPRDDIWKAMLPELEAIFPCRFEQADLTPEEWQRAQELEPEIKAGLER